MNPLHLSVIKQTLIETTTCFNTHLFNTINVTVMRDKKIDKITQLTLGVTKDNVALLKGTLTY